MAARLSPKAPVLLFFLGLLLILTLIGIFTIEKFIWNFREVTTKHLVSVCCKVTAFHVLIFVKKVTVEQLSRMVCDTSIAKANHRD